MVPDVLILGQITIDDTVPAIPGPWHRCLGGNALYSAAGARLWCAPERIGIVARVSRSLPFDVHALLEEAGLSAAGLVAVDTDALIEWIVYEEDGNRQSIPRNAALRDPSVTAADLFTRYLVHLESLSASFDQIPRAWLPAKAIHMAPQVLSRHLDSCRALADKTGFLSVDPSPHYSRGSSAERLAEMLFGSTAFLPSQAEVQHLLTIWPDWPSVAAALRDAGLEEVVLKQGAAGALLASSESNAVTTFPAAIAAVKDLTGAGDAFSGAYAASRAMGHTPAAATARATVAAAMIVECTGATEALTLSPEVGESRLAQYLSH